MIARNAYLFVYMYKHIISLKAEAHSPHRGKKDYIITIISSFNF